MYVYLTELVFNSRHPDPGACGREVPTVGGVEGDDRLDQVDQVDPGNPGRNSKKLCFDGRNHA